jgi:hypothetical protein
VKRFASNPDVAFGDVNLQTDPIRGKHSPGAGGWPTIKYFNKETGYEGAPYTKKTSDAMCDELGNIDNMQAYVMEAGGTSLCSVETKAGCSDKEITYIDKFAAKTADEQAAQLERLNNMAGKSMKESLKSWISQRKAILKQFTAKHQEL